MTVRARRPGQPRRKIPTRTYFVGKGLTKGKAIKKAARLDRPRDYRGATYDATTGLVRLT